MVTFRPLTKSSAAEYFKTDLSRKRDGADAGYYLATGAVPPVWGGKLAVTLGLTGPPTQEQVQRLLDGYHPITGENMVQRRTKNRRQGYDVVVSAPKSVSVMSMFDDRIPALVREADRLAMLELEANAAVRVRAGKQDYSQTTGNLLWLQVEHQESRELDPLLHAHHVIPNFTQAPDGSLKALEPGQALRRCRLFTEIFRNRLAQGLRSAGYELKQAEDGFELTDVPPDICKLYSKSRAKIEEAEEELEGKLGREISNDERAVLAKDVKRAKIRGLSPEELRAYQLSQLSEAAQAALRAAAARAKSAETPPVETPPQGAAAAAAAAVFARDHLFARTTITQTFKVAEWALRHSQGRATWAQIKQAIGKLDLIHQETDCTTAAAQALERGIISYVEGGCGVCPVLAGHADVSGLAPEQEALVKTVLGSRDRVTVIEAPPGAGKSYCLRSLSKAIPGVVCCAPTAAAVEVLEGDGIAAKTLDSLLNDRKSHAGIKTVIVDEGSLVSSAQCAKLLSYAQHHGWRLVMQGDRRQNRAVAAGSPFALILQYTDTTRGELREIRRQRTKPYRRAVKLMARGQMDLGLTALEKMKAVEVSDDPDERRRATARYYADACEWGTVAAVAPTWREITESTRAIRAELRARGRLANEETEFTTLQNIDLTVAQRRHLRYWPDDGQAYFTRRVGKVPLGTVGKFLGPHRDRKQGYVVRAPGLELIGEADLEAIQPVREVKIRLSPGDKILLQANGACEDGRKLTNGTTAQIESIKDGRIALKDGRTLPPDYIRFSLGYITTAFSAQGVTANTALAILPVGAGITRKSVFVALSRGRDAVKLFTDDLITLRDQLDAAIAQREHAIEITKPAAPAQSRGMGGKTLEAAGQSRPHDQTPGLDETPGFSR
jgi:conjugative relaxase-like TrwC/TraI family protein